MAPLPLVAGVVVGQWGGGSYPQRAQRYPQAILEGLEVEFAMAPLLLVAGVEVGQWGGGSYPQRAQRYPQQQVSYVGYTPPTRNSYGGRGWRGARGGRGRGRGRGAAPARGGRRTRRDEPEQPVKPTTLTVNGKTVRPEDIAAQAEEGSPHEDNSAADNEVEGAQPQKTKTAKNMKKNIGKGKKKSSNPKTDAQLEVNGPLDKNKMEQNHKSEKEHMGQGDAPVSN
ncbi:uncharacterized protein LOC135071361 [Ostrinia nubilalis]|uniref:uncharacterized protein LOC135071361 n=1 Tax=Ostrinia nubilalis TaxID=29057 RepID=UPI0030823CB9